MRMKMVLLVLIGGMVAGNAARAEYTVQRSEDQPFMFKIGSVVVNEGSSLVRESIVLNDATCPVSIKDHSVEVIFKDRRFVLTGTTNLVMRGASVAVEIRHILFDLFGQHMKNLSNLEVKDFAEGLTTATAEWRTADNDVGELLTVVSYVSRVRLEDGTQWKFDREALQRSLASLGLDQTVGDGREEGADP